MAAGTRPAEPSAPAVPHLTGESYLLIDLQRLVLADLPEDNLVSMLARAHGLREVAPLVDDALRAMRDGPREELREVFFPWFGELAERFGIDLEFLEDREMLAKREEQGEVRLLVEERLQAQLDGIAARNLEKGRAEGLERERALLRRLVTWLFGADTAQQLDPLLAATKDPERPSDVGNWITDCANGQELLERLQNGDQAARARDCRPLAAHCAGCGACICSGARRLRDPRQSCMPSRPVRLSTGTVRNESCRSRRGGQNSHMRPCRLDASGVLPASRSGLGGGRCPVISQALVRVASTARWRPCAVDTTAGTVSGCMRVGGSVGSTRLPRSPLRRGFVSGVPSPPSMAAARSVYPSARRAGGRACMLARLGRVPIRHPRNVSGTGRPRGFVLFCGLRSRSIARSSTIYTVSASAFPRVIESSA